MLLVSKHKHVTHCSRRAHIGKPGLTGAPLVVAMETDDESLIQDISKKVSLLLAPAPRSAHLELEARLGKCDSEGFCAGVSAEFFEALVHKMDICSAWYSVTPWQEYEDVIFNDVRGLAVRQTVFANRESCNLSISTQQKRHRCKLTFGATTCKSCPLDSNVGHVRIAVSEEIPVSKDDLPSVVMPVYVRFKQRRSYTERSSNKDSFWRYDLTKSWSGKTKQDAEQKSQGMPPVYEVEVEWVPSPNANWNSMDKAAVVRSLIKRIKRIGELHTLFETA